MKIMTWLVLLWENNQVHALTFGFGDIVFDTRPVAMGIVVVDAILRMGSH